MTQRYEIGTTDAAGAFVSVAQALATALQAPSSNVAQAHGFGASRTVSVTYPAGAQDPVRVQSDLIAKIVQAEQLTAQGDHVLAPDGSLLV